jgi:hypothetical protein
MNPESARDLWARLGEEGKPPADPQLACEALPEYTVSLRPWIERIGRSYLQDLSRRQAHFKLVLAPYGGGKTHFLLTLAQAAAQENYASSYVPCSAGLSFSDPLVLYRSVVRGLLLPGEQGCGLSRFLTRVVASKTKVIEESGAPDPGAAFGAWLRSVQEDEHPEPAFGRVIVEALRAVDKPEEAPLGEAAARWLRGEVDTLTKDEFSGLRLAKTSKSDREELGRNMLMSLLRFIPSAGVYGSVLLFDEVETLFSAKGKALQRLLGAMRVMVDLPTGVPGGIPLFGVFAAIPDVLSDLGKYKALEMRLSVAGAPFEDGNDRSAQMNLSNIAQPVEFLTALAEKLVGVGTIACDHCFDAQVQRRNAGRLARIATERNLDIDARRLFVKAWVNLLDHQARQGEKDLADEELAARYAGTFDGLREREQSEDD